MRKGGKKLKTYLFGVFILIRCNGVTVQRCNAVKTQRRNGIKEERV